MGKGCEVFLPEGLEEVGYGSGGHPGPQTGRTQGLSEVWVVETCNGKCGEGAELETETDVGWPRPSQARGPDAQVSA